MRLKANLNGNSHDRDPNGPDEGRTNNPQTSDRGLGEAQAQSQGQAQVQDQGGKAGGRKSKAPMVFRETRAMKAKR